MTGSNKAASEFDEGTFDIGGITVFHNDLNMTLESLLGLIILSIAFSLFSIVIFYTADLFGGILSVILSFFLWALVVLFIYQIVWQKRRVVLSPAGLQDSNVTTETIPWSAVESVRSLRGGLSIKRPMAVMLKLKPSAVGTLKFPRRTRFLRLLKNDELWIAFGFWAATPGVRLSFDRFSGIIRAYARAYGQGVK
ncbi:hypothetical protein LGH82_07490 [Mesorhizobium sp. PAMC28654]|uniref:hypothetical protein n=1 Tax=Mesorhizobium sp. PAMC28654 TaxID=2880934 RepID=UPI001D0B05E7|nr:hypothetical protein [Mesorhizobium sp. PAMC28654]UDL91107.1 hypothetical protein LGH82_07490 [Mesorhizobium sp. PAMC28654]